MELRPNDQAVVDLGGIRKEISIALVADVKVGDYVIVHVGHAIGTIDPEEAERTLALFAEMARLNEERDSEPHAAGSVGAEVLS